MLPRSNPQEEASQISDVRERVERNGRLRGRHLVSWRLEGLKRRWMATPAAVDGKWRHANMPTQVAAAMARALDHAALGGLKYKDVENV